MQISPAGIHQQAGQEEGTAQEWQECEAKNLTGENLQKKLRWEMQC